MARGFLAQNEDTDVVAHWLAGALGHARRRH